MLRTSEVMDTVLSKTSIKTTTPKVDEKWQKGELEIVTEERKKSIERHHH